jgi:TonB family protein
LTDSKGQTKLHLVIVFSKSIPVSFFQGTRNLFSVTASVVFHLFLAILLLHSGSTTPDRKVVNLSLVSKNKGMASRITQEKARPDLTSPREKGHGEKESTGAKKVAKTRSGHHVNKPKPKGEISLATTKVVDQASDASKNTSYPNLDLDGSQGVEIASGGGNAQPESSREPQGISEKQNDLQSSRIWYAMLVRKMLEERQSYPLEAMEQEIQGTAKVMIEIANDGAVISVRLARSSGHKEIDEAILSAARSLKQLPKPPGGAMVVAVPLQFTLEEERF